MSIAKWETQKTRTRFLKNSLFPFDKGLRKWEARDRTWLTLCVWCVLLEYTH